MSLIQPSSSASARRRPGALRTGPAGLGVLVLVAMATLVAPTVLAAAAEVGYRDFYYGDTLTLNNSAANVTVDETQAKLWYNDGRWWGGLFNNGDAKYHVYRLDIATQTWIDTGTALDDRDSSRADILWSGNNKLYVASTTASKTSGALRVYRYSYDSVSKTYSKDGGFPVTLVQPAGLPKGATSVSIARDSTGQLWVTWMQRLGTIPESTRVYVAHSTGTDASWSAGAELPGQGTSALAQGVSGIVSFGNGANAAVGVLWSREVSPSSSATDNGFYFSSHLDSADDTTGWSAPELAYGGAYAADNHLSLATDTSGRVLAAVKTGKSADPGPNGSDPEIAVLRRTAPDTWETHKVTSVSDRKTTKPFIVVDSLNGQANVFFVRPESGQSTLNPRIVYRKQASLTDLAFATGLGVAIIKNTTDYYLNDPTSTKQKVSGIGIVVLASDTKTHYYLHGCIGSACAGP